MSRGCVCVCVCMCIYVCTCGGWGGGRGGEELTLAIQVERMDYLLYPPGCL